MSLGRPSARLALLFAPILLIVTLMLSLPVLAQDAAIEFVGQLQAQTSTTITVNGVTIDISSAEIDGPLTVGGLVKVEAVLINNQYVAREVDAGADDDLRPNEIELTGFVQAIDGTTLLIGGQTIDLTGAEIAASIDVGSIVRVHATVSETGALVARQVALFGAEGLGNNEDLGNNDDLSGNNDDFGNDDFGDDDDDEDFEIVGTLESVGDGTLTISGQQFDITQAQVDGLLALGSLVRIEFEQVNGQWVIVEVSGSRSRGTSSSDDDGNDDLGNNDLGIIGNNDDDDDVTFVCGQIPSGWTTYAIQQGDTLSGIASRSGSGLSAIVGVNCIANPNSVPVGTVLAVPRTPADRSLFVGNDDDLFDNEDDDDGLFGNNDDDHDDDLFENDDDHGDDNSGPGSNDDDHDDDHGGDRDDDHDDDHNDDDDHDDDHGGDRDDEEDDD
jgi:LysM repeat protein